MDSKDDLQKICETVMRYQKGLDNIDSYIKRLNEHVAMLNERLEKQDLTTTFSAYADQLKLLEEQITNLSDLYHDLTAGQSNMARQMRSIHRFNEGMEAFEESMKSFNQRVDSLSQKLYNKDFNNAIKCMYAIAEESRQSATYEYRHTTDHDYEILMHEYAQSLKGCRQKTAVRNLLQGIRGALLETRLKKEENESLQRLILKMVHSDSKSLGEFLDSVDEEAAKKSHRKTVSKV